MVKEPKFPEDLDLPPWMRGKKTGEVRPEFRDGVTPTPKVASEAVGMMSFSHDFEIWSNFWITTTSHYAQRYLKDYQPVNQFVTVEKIRIAKLVFNYLKPICIIFLILLLGRPNHLMQKKFLRVFV